MEIALSLFARYTSGGAHTRWAAVGEAGENLAVASLWRKRNKDPPLSLCYTVAKKIRLHPDIASCNDSFWIGIESAVCRLTKGAPLSSIQIPLQLRAANISRPRRCLPGRRVQAEVTDLSAIGRSGNERVRGRPFQRRLRVGEQTTHETFFVVETSMQTGS